MTKLFALCAAIAFMGALAGCAAPEEEPAQSQEATEVASESDEVVEEGTVAITPNAQGWVVDTDLTPGYEIAAVNDNGICISALPPMEEGVIKSRIVSCTVDGKEYPVGAADSPVTYTLVNGKERTDITNDPTYEVVNSGGDVRGVQFYVTVEGMSESDYRDVTLTIDEDITRGDTTEQRTGTVHMHR